MISVGITSNFPQHKYICTLLLSFYPLTSEFPSTRIESIMCFNMCQYYSPFVIITNDISNPYKVIHADTSRVTGALIPTQRMYILLLVPFLTNHIDLTPVNRNWNGLVSWNTSSSDMYPNITIFSDTRLASCILHYAASRYVITETVPS